jgi:hypothetical protein
MSEMTPEEFWSVLHAIPETKPVSYRLYYNDNGSPIIYSMEELPGNYIEVDQETYVIASFNIQVVDKKIVHNKPIRTITKLQPSNIGTACSIHDVCIVVDESLPHTKWNKTKNETN